MKNLKLITLSIVCTLGLLVSVYFIGVGYELLGTDSYSPLYPISGLIGAIGFAFAFMAGVVQLYPVTKTETVKDPDPAKIEYRWIEYRLPASWGSALVNGDYSGLEDDELHAVANFVYWFANKYGTCYCLSMSTVDEFALPESCEGTVLQLYGSVATFTFDGGKV